MRKSIIIFALLVAAGICGMCYAHSTLSAAQDNVSFTVVEEYGDISAADSLTVSVMAHMDYHLLWETAHTFGQTPRRRTDFSFHASQLQWLPEFVSSPISLSIPIAVNANASGGNLLGDGEGSLIFNTEFIGVYDMLQDVASRTQNGGQRTETLYLRDYFDYYPIYADIRAGEYDYLRQAAAQHIFQTSDEAEVNEAFSDFFRFPVPEWRTITITISKDIAGNVVEIRTGRANAGYSHETGVVSEEDLVYIYAVGVITEHGIYFTLSTEGISDFTGIPGGFGIYLLPAAKIIGEPGTEYLPTLDYKNIQTVYPLGDSTTVAELKFIRSLMLSEDSSCLNLITYEDGICFLTVIELESMAEKQKMPLFVDMGDTLLYIANFVDGLLYAALGDNRFMLAEKNADNTYRPVLAGARDYLLSIEDFLYWNEPQIAWDGKRLALVTPYRRYIPVDADVFHYSNVDTCGFTLEIHGESGLMYKGAYESSLDVLTISAMSYDICRLVGAGGLGGLSARWQETISP